MKYNVKSIMTRAWEIKHQDARNYFAECLKMAWAEAKNSKIDFTGYAVLQKVDLPFNLVFKRWSNYGKDRVYITREGYRESVGYINLMTGEFVPAKYTCKAFSADAENFLNLYNVA